MNIKIVPSGPPIRGLDLQKRRSGPFLCPPIKYVKVLLSQFKPELYGSCRFGVVCLLLDIMKDETRFTYIVTDSGCHEITSHKVSGHIRYPRTQINGKSYAIHRLIYERVNGPIAPGQVVRHSCDNPKCININHLLIGTQADNMNDKVERGRHVVGSKVKNSKLTESEVLDIKEMAPRLGITFTAKVYEVHHSVITNILQGRTWKHVKTS